MTNPILKEIHDIRRQILAEHGTDLGAYLRREFQKTKASGHPIARIKQRSIRVKTDTVAESVSHGSLKSNPD